MIRPAALVLAMVCSTFPRWAAARTYEFVIRRTVALPAVQAARTLTWETRSGPASVRLGRTAEGGWNQAGRPAAYNKTRRQTYVRSGPDRRKPRLGAGVRQRDTTWEAFAAGVLGPDKNARTHADEQRLRR